MAGKTMKRDMYVAGLQEAGDGNVRVVLRDGDPPHMQKTADAEAEMTNPRRAARREDLNLNLSTDEAPAMYEKLSLTLEKR